MTTYTTTKGHTFESAFDTDEAAAQYIIDGDRPSNFGLDLARKVGRLSPRQRPWLHKIATDMVRSTEREVALDDAPNYVDIVELFDRAAAARIASAVEAGKTLEHPRLFVKLASVRLKWLTRGRFPGSVGVLGAEKTEAGDWGPTYPWYGRIYASGLFEASDKCPDGVRAVLESFNENPSFVAANYGKLHNECCFCEAELTDARSVLTGYGAKCASNYGLPYCELSLKDAEAEVERQKDAALDGDDDEETMTLDGPEPVEVDPPAPIERVVVPADGSPATVEVIEEFPEAYRGASPRARRIENALRVIVETKLIRDTVELIDPKAIEQALEALAD